MEEFVAILSSKGQIVIAKPIRDQLGIEQNQPFKERIEDGKIVLEPMPTLMDLRGILKGKSKKSVDQMVREADDWWE